MAPRPTWKASHCGQHAQMVVWLNCCKLSLQLERNGKSNGLNDLTLTWLNSGLRHRSTWDFCFAVQWQSSWPSNMQFAHTHINHTSLIAQWKHHQPNQSMKDCDILRQPTAAHVLPCALSAAASELSVLVLPPWLQVTCANSTVGFCASNEPHAAWPHGPEHVIPHRGSQGDHLITLDLYTSTI